MTKTLYMMRHAKAAQTSPSGDDHSRPLNERGQAATKRMGEEIAKLGFAPELVLCSDAARTRETLELLQKAAGQHWPCDYSDRLYLASHGDLLHEVNSLPDKINSALLIGHNPGFHLFSHEMSAKGDDAMLMKLEEKFPTATFVAISLPEKPWEEMIPGDGWLTHCIRPEDLDATLSD